MLAATGWALLNWEHVRFAWYLLTAV